MSDSDTTSSADEPREGAVMIGLFQRRPDSGSRAPRAQGTTPRYRSNSNSKASPPPATLRDLVPTRLTETAR